MGTDIGGYLRSLRFHKRIKIQQIADALNLKPNTIRNIERGDNPPPSEDRLRIWLNTLGESSRYHEAVALLRSIKTRRTIAYLSRNPANEHIDRLLDAYEQNRLTTADLAMLEMIAPNMYDRTRKQTTDPNQHL